MSSPLRLYCWLQLLVSRWLTNTMNVKLTSKSLMASFDDMYITDISESLTLNSTIVQFSDPWYYIHILYINDPNKSMNLDCHEVAEFGSLEFFFYIRIDRYYSIEHISRNENDSCAWCEMERAGDCITELIARLKSLFAGMRIPVLIFINTVNDRITMPCWH